MRKSSPDSARRRQLATSLNEFLTKPTLGKALQLLARHPELLGNFVIEWLRLMRRVLRNRTRAREELLRSLPHAVDEQSLARIRRWSEDAERVGDTDTSRLFSQTAFKMTSLRDQMTRAANKLYDRSVVEILFAVGSARNEHEAFERVQQNIQIALDHNFVPALMQVRHQLLQWPEAPTDVEQVVIATMRLVHSTLLKRTTSEIGEGGICTALMASDGYERLTHDVDRFRFLLGDPFFEEWNAMTREFEARALREFGEGVRARGDVLAFLLTAPKLDQLVEAIKHSASTRTGIEHIIDTAHKEGRWIVRGCQTIAAMAETDAEKRIGDVSLVNALIHAREWLDQNDPRDTITEKLMQDELLKMYVDVQRARAAPFESKEELVRVASALSSQFGAMTQLILADTVEEAKTALAAEPGLFSRQAERELNENAERFKERADWAERFRRTASWLHQLRNEFADTQHNIIAQLGTRVGAKELTLEQALAELEMPETLDKVTILYLGALDEKIINLRDVGDFAQAEILAVLNHSAAQKIGSPKMKAYANLSLAELWLGQSKSADKTLSLLQTAEKIAEGIDDTRMLVRAIGTIGIVYQQTSRYQDALQAYHRGLLAARKANLTDAEIACLNNLVGTNALIGDVARAETFGIEALQIARSSNDREAEYKVLAQLATVFYKVGRTQDSIKYYEDALQIARQFGDLVGEANMLSNLWQAYFDAGHMGSAEDMLNQTLVLAREMNNCRLEGIALWALGRMYFRRGDMQQATRLFHGALESMREVGDSDGVALLLSNLGRANMVLGQFDDAYHLFRESIETMEKVRAGVVGESERIAFLGFDRVYPYMNMVKLLITRDGWFHPSEALEIIERARTRVFIEQLALTPVLIESSLDPELRAQERKAIAEIQRLTTSLRVTQQLETTHVQTRLIMANELAQAQQGLQELWNAPGVSDQYLDLRRGQPISFEQLRHLLAL